MVRIMITRFSFLRGLQETFWDVKIDAKIVYILFLVLQKTVMSLDPNKSNKKITSRFMG